MRQLKNIGLFILCLQLLVSCKTGNSIVVDDGNNRKEINYAGDIVFNDDETDIESISSDGYLRFMSNGRKLIVESNYHGGLTYEMYRNGHRIDKDGAEGKKFLADAINQMLGMGFNIQKRMERLYAKGGNPALLRAAVDVDGNYAKQLYLEYVLNHGNPSANDLVDVANITAFKIEGAFEKAQVLKKFPHNAFDNAEVTDTWFGAVKTVDSDFEKANILKEVSNENFQSAAFSGKWLIAVQGINSDFEKTNALKMMVNQPLDDEQYRQSITVINTVESDFEHSNILKEMIDKKVPDNEETFKALIGSIHGVESDFEQSNILKKLIERGLSTDKQWEALLKESATLDNDFEKANVFVAAAEKMPKTDELKAIYSSGAKTINSEFEQQRAMKGIEQD